MISRVEQMYNIWVNEAFPDILMSWNDLEYEAKAGWYAVAEFKDDLINMNANRWQEEIDRLKVEASTMVPRKHYKDAIGSLAACQSMIESLVREVERMFPKSEIAADGRIVLGGLEAMISFNPDMQTDEWKARENIKQDERDVEYKSFVNRLKWSKDNINGTVQKDYQP